MSWALGSQTIESVLLTRLRYLGDIVMSTVLIDVLKRGAPDLVVGYLCEDDYADVLQGRRGLDHLHRLGAGRHGGDAQARATQGGGFGGARGTAGTILDLRRTSYDLAVDLFFNPRSAWLLKLAGIPQRIGGTTRWRGRLYTHRVMRSDVEARHPGFDLLAPGGLGEHLCRLAPLTQVETGLDFPTWLQATHTSGELMPRLDRPAVRAQGDPSSQGGADPLAGLGLNADNPYILLAPCATWPSKEWPLEQWAALTVLLVEQSDLPLVVLVAPGRDDHWSGLSGLIPPGRGGLLPVLPLDQALALTAGALALITVDGGIMHAAVAYNVPTVALFGPTDPGIWFPYEGGGPFRVLARAPHCHPCDLHVCPQFICLPELEPDDVLRTLSGLLGSAGPAGRGRS